MFKPLFAAALITALASPLAAQSIVGKWDCNARAGANLDMKTLQQYRSSGAFYHLANMAIGDRRQRFDVAVAMQGNWSAEKDTLIENITTVRVRSVQANGQDITNTPIGKSVARSVRRELLRPNTPSRIRLRTLTDRKMTFADGPFRASCTRR